MCRAAAGFGAGERRLELLAPAQGPEQLALALHFGADAVYLAGPRWGMRAQARNFTMDELADAVSLAHATGAQVHLTLNTVMTDDDLCELPAFLAQVDELGVDAAIVADLGVMELLARCAPHVALHVSTQASVMSAAAAEAYARLGASRVVLAREMSLTQIAALRRHLTRELELEVFAHGSLCMAYSGRCLLSVELMGAGRSASRGACAQPCRWDWRLVEAGSKAGAAMGPEVPLEVDARGSYLLSSYDLCLIEHLDDLREAGVDALKLEGRAKGSYYTACVTNAYRQVLDGAAVAPWRGELDAVSHRPYSTGFLFGQPGQGGSTEGYVRERRMVGVVRSCETCATGGWLTTLTCRNRADQGSVLEVLSPGADVRTLALGPGMLELVDADGGRVAADALVRNGATYVLRTPWPLEPWDLVCVR